MSYPDTVRDLLGSMTEKNNERQHLINVLAMWDEVARQGYHPDDIATFTFSTDGVSKRELEKIRHAHWPLTSSGHVHCAFYNRVRFHDGTLHVLNPMIAAPK